MKILGLEAFTTCDRAIREGMIYDYIANNQKKIKREGEIPI